MYQIRIMNYFYILGKVLNLRPRGYDDLNQQNVDTILRVKNEKKL
jgi:hypothetical protein